MGWVEAICLASRPGPQGQVTEHDRASVGWRSHSSSPAKTFSCMVSLARAVWARIELAARASAIGVDRRAPRWVEQVAGIEPGDSGVAHRRVTSTLHLLGGLERDLDFWNTL